MNVLKPALCLYCQTRIEEQTGWAGFLFLQEEEQLCHVCRSQLVRIGKTICKLCGRPLKEEGICGDCARWEADSRYRGVLTLNRSFFQYNAFLKAYMARFKYCGDYELARLFAGMVRKSMPQVDLIVPIPLSTERLAERGFNQAKAIGEHAALQMTEALIRIPSEKQAKKKRHERLAREQVFQLATTSADFTGKKVLLLDDIYTTGTTLRQAALTVKEAGASTVQSMTIAR